ncbi:MAG: hypothetical protein HQ500_08840 [Flavobacteriales bacterium]|nr:hypothetical protein [Flavobacteriales bacterium]
MAAELLSGTLQLATLYTWLLVVVVAEQVTPIALKVALVQRQTHQPTLSMAQEMPQMELLEMAVAAAALVLLGQAVVVLVGLAMEQMEPLLLIRVVVE